MNDVPLKKPESKEHEKLYSDFKSNRLVIVANPYNGEDHILLLKMKVMSKFVDYFVITEGFFSHTGIQKKL